MKYIGPILLTLIITLIFAPTPAHAKKKKKQPKAETQIEKSAVLQRMGNLSPDDLRRFDSLSQHQKDLIVKGRIETGFNEWMVRLAVGEPFYRSEHHPVYTDYEEVWLYTRPDVRATVREERIFDRQTNWPSVHRVTRRETCAVGYYFLLWDRGVIQGINPVRDKKVYGSCTIETQEAFLPIVDGRPVEPK